MQCCLMLKKQNVLTCNWWPADVMIMTSAVRGCVIESVRTTSRMYQNEVGLLSFSFPGKVLCTPGWP